MGTETTQRTTNPYQWLLLGLGVALVIAGGITANVANGAAQDAETFNGYRVAMSGIYASDSGPTDVAYAWMWAGIIGAIIGVLVILSFIIVKAVRR